MKREHVDEIFDAFLKSTTEQTLEELYDEYIQKYPDSEQEELPELDQKMNKIFRMSKAKQKRVYVSKRVRRVAVLLIAIMGIGSFGIMQVDAWKVKISNFVLDISDGKIMLNFGDNQNARRDKVLMDNIKTPEYLPNGFHAEDVVQLDTKTTMSFSHGKDKITYEQEVLEDVGYNETAPDGKYEIIKINGMDGRIIQHNGITKIIWKDNQYIYRLTGNLARAEMIEISKNVK